VHCRFRGIALCRPFLKSNDREYPYALRFLWRSHDLLSESGFWFHADREIAIEIAKHRDILYRWILETDDKGRFPETDNALRAVVDRWGSKAVNREYNRVRE
jgi:hypothetical protein